MNTSRRQFLGGAAASFFIGGCATTCAPRKVGPNEKVNVAIIGCGWIARFENVPKFLKDDRCRVTVACDMVKLAPGYFYGDKPKGGMRDNAFEGGFDNQKGEYPRDVCGSTVIKHMVDKHYGDKACREVFDWRDVIDDPTIDAVCIATPDHWHAIIAIAAMKAGKHVFCQKPMSLSIAEGIAMTKVAKETGVTYQVGNQGRSNRNYIFTENLVLNGYCGKVYGGTVSIPSGDHWTGHGRSPERTKLPNWMTPEAWELWQGPAEHWENNAFIPSIHEPTCWRFNRRTGNGMVTDFGAHEFDEIQRGLGTDVSGPVSVENVKAEFSPEGHREIFSWATKQSFDFVYGDGRIVKVLQIDKEKGVLRKTVWDTELGPIGVDNGKTVIPEKLKSFKPTDFKSTDRLVYCPKGDHWHEADFIDGILESRQCCAPCEVGHRTISMAHLANAAITLGVSKLGWDPAKEVFVGEHAAEAMAKCYANAYHNGWSLGV